MNELSPTSIEAPEINIDLNKCTCDNLDCLHKDYQCTGKGTESVWVTYYDMKGHSQRVLIRSCKQCAKKGDYER